MREGMCLVKRHSFPRLLLAAVIVSCLISSASAVYFHDIQPDSWYYEAVTSLAEQGIVNGTGDGCFSPERPITAEEFVVMLTRSAGEYAHTGERWSSFAIRHANSRDWLDASTDIGSDLTREYAAKLLICCAGYTMWDQPNASFPDAGEITEMFDDYVVAAERLGLMQCFPDGSFRPKGVVSRAEACVLLSRLQAMTFDDNALAPDCLTSFDIGYLSPEALSNSFVSRQRLVQIPYKILMQFAADGWTLYYTEDLTSVFPEYKGVTGVTSRSTSNIYVSASSIGLHTEDQWTVVHEIGHYVFSKQSEQALSVINQSYEAEADLLADLLHRNYCTSSVSEFFAEAFKSYIAYGTSFLSEVPQTRNAVEQAIAAFPDDP